MSDAPKPPALTPEQMEVVMRHVRPLVIDATNRTINLCVKTLCEMAAKTPAGTSVPAFALAVGVVLQGSKL